MSSKILERTSAFGELHDLTWVDRLGVWLSLRQVHRFVPKFAGNAVGDFGCGYQATLGRTIVGVASKLTLVDVSIAPDLKEELMPEAANIGRDNWDQHWTEYAASAQLNPAQGYRRQLISHFLSDASSKRPSRIMDLGSGQGDLLADLSQLIRPAAMLGVELSATGIEIAACKVPVAAFLQLDLSLPVSAECPYRGWADYAICAEVLEHLDDPGSFLKNSTALMSPGCSLIVTVPGGPMSAFDRHIGHRKHYSVAELSNLLERSGFSVKTAAGAGFPFFNLYRIAVILRGRALIQDVSTNSSETARLASSALMRLFRALFAFNRNQGNLGWQTVAVAEWNGPGT